MRKILRSWSWLTNLNLKTRLMLIINSSADVLFSLNIKFWKFKVNGFRFIWRCFWVLWFWICDCASLVYEVFFVLSWLLCSEWRSLCPFVGYRGCDSKYSCEFILNVFFKFFKHNVFPFENLDLCQHLIQTFTALLIILNFISSCRIWFCKI